MDGVKTESKMLSEEDYAHWEKAFLALMSGGEYTTDEAVSRADSALDEMRARNPRAQKSGPYR